MAKLFIVGFPKDMEEIELVEIFSVYGTVNTVTIITDKQTNESKGYGFVTMTDDAGANRAIAALDGSSIDDRTISVRFAEDKPAIRPTFKSSNPKSYANNPINPRRDNRTDTPKAKRPRRKL